MDLRSIDELLKIRKKLVKQLNAPVPSNLPYFDIEIWKAGTEAQRQTIEDIDAEIRQRTSRLIEPLNPVE